MPQLKHFAAQLGAVFDFGAQPAFVILKRLQRADEFFERVLPNDRSVVACPSERLNDDLLTRDDQSGLGDKPDGPFKFALKSAHYGAPV